MDDDVARRRAAFRRQSHARVVRAFDNFLRDLYGELQVIDRELDLQHNRHYGASDLGHLCNAAGDHDFLGVPFYRCVRCGLHIGSQDADADPCAGGRCPDPEAHAEGAHDV